MNDLILITIVAFGGAGLLIATINALMNKDNRIAELEHALIEAYTEIEFSKLGLTK